MSLKRAKHKQASELFAEALACFADFPPKNREKIIDFLFKFIETGNKSQSAIRAGFGNVLGNKKTEDQIRNCAAQEADRYLKNVKVKKAYDALRTKRDMEIISNNLSTKEHTISLLNQIAINSVDIAPSAAQKAIVEAAKMKGYYEDDTDSAGYRVDSVTVIIPKVPNEVVEEKERIKALGYQEVSTEEENAVTKVGVDEEAS